jgi:hypothetical protein
VKKLTTIAISAKIAQTKIIKMMKTKMGMNKMGASPINPIGGLIGFIVVFLFMITIGFIFMWLMA